MLKNVIVPFQLYGSNVFWILLYAVCSNSHQKNIAGCKDDLFEGCCTVYILSATGQTISRPDLVRGEVR